MFPFKATLASKENPVNKPSIFGQSSNNASNQNITPSPANQNVRRSSRLFVSTQSVKENSKAPTKKPRPPKSPSRKTNKGRIALSTSDLDEKNEKNKAEKEKDVDPSDEKEDKKISTNSLNSIILASLGQEALVIQKQSVSGLMALMRQFGEAYVELAKYNCKKALRLLDCVAPSHRNSGWVLGLKGKAHFELGEYRDSKDFFEKMRDREPCRLENTEYFSTALWHLQVSR